jgi:hypothetical protein
MGETARIAEKPEKKFKDNLSRMPCLHSGDREKQLQWTLARQISEDSMHYSAGFNLGLQLYALSVSEKEVDEYSVKENLPVIAIAKVQR